MTTYYVRSSGGNDANDGLSFANAFATIQKAADTAAAGDDVRICADGTHTSAVRVDIDTNSGTAADPIVFTGANGTDGSDDGSVATLSFTGVNTFGFYGDTIQTHLHFKNLDVSVVGRGAFTRTNNMYVSNVTVGGSAQYFMQTCDYAVIENSTLEGTNAGSINDASNGCIISNCFIDHSSSSNASGAFDASNFRHDNIFIGCVVKEATLGADVANANGKTALGLIDCIFDTCTTGVSITATDSVLVSSCVFYDCGIGIDASSANADGSLVVENSIFKDCTEAIELGATVNTSLIERRNVFHGNTRNVSSDTTELGIHASSVTTDPSFSDAANGDFTVTEATLIQRSVAWEDGNNTSYLDAGAVQSEVTAGGNGLIIEPPIQIGL